jgi:membrane protein DedA with SNARE-associated domain
VEHLLGTYGLALLFVLITLESAGIPLPGETALITASILASQGHFRGIVPVIIVASGAAIIGDNGGYWAARLGALRLIERSERLKRFADRVLPPSERFFARHGGKTVFFGRFIAILRFTAAWLAGLSKMTWWRFLFWNAAGGICWATGFGLLSYYLGDAAAKAIDRYGYVAAGAIAAVVVIAFFVLRYWKKRMGIEPEVHSPPKLPRRRETVDQRES